jgi:hypothetical protein
VKRTPTIIDAINAEHLFARWFRNRRTWSAWLAFLCALFALPMGKEALQIYRECTGRSQPPKVAASEAWLACGRRSGKSFILALCAVFLAAFHDYRRYLSPGERGTVFILASDRKQARVILRYIGALLAARALQGARCQLRPGREAQKRIVWRDVAPAQQREAGAPG